MLSIGGTKDCAADFCDWGPFNDTWNGLCIYDMVNLNWTTSYDSKADPYVPSSLVTDFYANNSRYPASWGDPTLSSIFQDQAAIGTAPATNETNTSNPVAPPKASNPTGAIAGGVVGSIAALALIGAAFFWVLRKRKGYGRAAQRDPHDPTQSHEMDPSEYRKTEMQGDERLVHEMPGNEPRMHDLPTNGQERDYR